MTSPRQDEVGRVVRVPISTKELLVLQKQMANSGDPIMAIFAKAWLVQHLKSQDYNQHSRDAYWPFGLVSFVQMLHVKVQRLISLATAKVDRPNFESATDTGLDLINYAAFMVEWLERNKR